MFKSTKWKLHLAAALALIIVLNAAFVARAADPVTVTIAVSGNELKWLTNSVKAAFEKKMADAGTPVTLNLLDTGNLSGEAQKQQLALDLKVGKGSDLFSFDGFW